MSVIGGPPIAALGYGFALVPVPVGVNAVSLAAIGVSFHRLPGHNYPRVAVVPGAAIAVATAGGTMPHLEDIDRALADLGETFDVSREDLDLLLERAEFHSERRVRGD